jgi:hypothetical protein
MPKSNDPARTVSGDAIPLKAFDRYMTAIAGEAEINAEYSDNASITASIAEKMLLSDDLETAFEAQDSGLISGQNLVDIEHEVLTFEIVKSSKPDAVLGHYLRVSAVALEDSKKLGLTVGVEFQYAVGAPNVVTLLYKARALDRLPLRVVIKEKATGTDGNSLLLLRMVPKR